MRLRLILLVGATCSLVLVAFLVPLAVLIRSTTANRVTSEATVTAQSLAPAVATVDEGTLTAAVSSTNSRTGYQTTVFLPDGRTIGQAAPRSAAVLSAAGGQSTTAKVAGGKEVAVAVAGLNGGTAVIRTFVSDDQLRAGVARSWAVLCLLGLCLLVVSLLVADRLAQALIRPLSAVADVSFRLAQGALAVRAADVGPPEVRQVSVGLNHLAGRITELLAQERALVADLSHRLRTPLTALRIDVESVTDPTTRARLVTDLDAVDRTVDSVIREANRPRREGTAAACDAAEVVAERTQFWSVLADEEDRQMAVAIAARPIKVRLDREDLSACVDALIGNVFRHTAEGVDFAVSVEPGPAGGGRLVVTDHGPGLPDQLVQQRGRSGAGSTGLGLDIVTRTANRSGGTVTLGRAPGGGAAIILDMGPPLALPGQRTRSLRRVAGGGGGGNRPQHAR
jgi:signal transduction histidine kinase